MPRVLEKLQKTRHKEKANAESNDNFDNDYNENDRGFAPEGYDEDENLLNMEIPVLPSLFMNTDGSGQRLMISHLEVENFKSYYGKQTIGPFHKVLILKLKNLNYYFYRILLL